MSARALNFTEAEDVQLCNSFLAVSFDSVVGTNQNAKALWDRVLLDYNNRIDGDLQGTRTATPLSNRWVNVINPRCSFFSGCLTQVKNGIPSGTNVADDVSFYHVFILEHE
jgi:hypothetical protein